MRHQDSHPQPIEGCLGCKVLTLSYPGVFATRSLGSGKGDRTAQKKWDAELDAYKDARRQGVQPASTKMPDIRAAMKASEIVGRAYDATDGSFK